MIPWFLADPARLEHEAAQIDQLRSSEPWLAGATWSFEGTNLCVYGTIRVHEYDYDVRLEYPALFPAVPILVRPAKEHARWSAHQYGSGGPLCLEWRSDNWHPGVTGAEMLRSAYRLLSTENPLGRSDVPPAEVPSAHRVTVGQGLRGNLRKLRFIFSAESLVLLRTLPPTTNGRITLAVVFSGNENVAHLRSLTISGVPTVLPSLPTNAAFGATDFEGEIRVLESHGNTWRQVGTVAELNALLPPEAALRVDDTGKPEVVLLIAGDGEVILFFLLESSLHATALVLDDSDLASRLPVDCKLLRHTKVGIVGIGSLGSKIAVTLAHMGVRDFLLIDDDIVLAANLERGAFDMRDLARHKANALVDKIHRLAPDASVHVRLVNLTAQESSSTVASVVDLLGMRDLLIDATANQENFNIMAAIATAAGLPLVWSEVFGGGYGGLVARWLPSDPFGPHNIRAAFLGYCETNPAPDGAVRTAYGQEAAGSAPQVASDADVSIIAGHTTRFAADATRKDGTVYPYSLYLIGLAPWWIFRAPFDTIPIDVPVPQASPSADEDLPRRGRERLQTILANK
jgi:hypothetical protein